MSIGSRVRQYRDNKSLSQSDLAIRAEVSQSAISSLESDKSIPNAVMLHRIAIELGVDIHVLLEDKKSPQHHSKEAINNTTQLVAVDVQNFKKIVENLMLNQGKITQLMEAQGKLIEALTQPITA